MFAFAGRPTTATPLNTAGRHLVSATALTMIAPICGTEHQFVQIIITGRDCCGHLNVDIEVTDFHAGRRHVLALTAVGVVSIVYFGGVHVQIDDFVCLSKYVAGFTQILTRIVLGYSLD